MTSWPSGHSSRAQEVARATGLHGDQAGLKLAKEWYPPAPTQRPAEDTLSNVIDGVYLKNVLGQINADSANFHSAWLLLLVVVDDNHTLAPRCREREPSTPSALTLISSASPPGTDLQGGAAEGPFL